MTEKQQERIRNKIGKIKKALAADKKHWGGFYHDGKGLRYLIPELFIKLNDYNGGLKYLQWFDKTFPDDSGYPIFLFEWTLILFKKGKIVEAEKKACETFFSNTYLFDKFLGKELLHLDKSESSNWEFASLADHFHYQKTDAAIVDFAEWLAHFLASKKFCDFANEFIEIEKKLKYEPVGNTRTQLVKRKYKLLAEI